MTVSEALGDAAETVEVRVFATDIDSAAIAFARRGDLPAGRARERARRIARTATS